MKKQEKKLMKYNEKAQYCTSREEAQTILKKFNKAHAKLQLKRMISND